MESLVLGKRKGTCLRFNATGVRNMGTTKEIVLRSRKTTKEEEKKPISPKKYRKLKRRSPRMRK